MANANSATSSSNPWWREPWPWLLMAGPFLAIVGCAITIFLAFQSYGDQAIYDGGVKRGLKVEKAAEVQAPAQARPGSVQ